MRLILTACTNKFLIPFFALFLISGRFDSLRTRIDGIVKNSDGIVGVTIIGTGINDTITINNNHRFPMQSVFKFPLALDVLNKVDNGILSLDQKIHITKNDLLPDTWSPLRSKYPDGNVDITLRELLSYTVSESDNNGCDILFRLVGGPAEVNKYVHKLGIKEMEIAATEEEMHKAWNVQYLNWSTPHAMAQLFYMFDRDSILSSSSRNFLWELMVSNIYGSKRIKGQLPANTVVAHKTGSSGVNDNIAAATNDAGIILLPDNKHLVMVVFVSDSPASEDIRDRVISDIAKVTWDDYSTNK